MKMIFNPPKHYAYVIKHIMISVYCFLIIGLVGTFFFSDTYKNMVGKIQYGTASWYGNESICWQWEGYTKNGEMFDETKMTCAVINKDLMNRWYKVTNIINGKSVKVWANDTGAFEKLGRIVDLSKAAFAKIANLDEGLVEVKVVDLSK